ncbi:restriction endonuclease subunit S [Prevotella copri]|uniref:Restriction endonuclease subunit S n=1 Tax=Segatella copri TaxID=165179 RepID=A0A6I2U077_9BACT|nr:restriction endonuclease subunit S [Segatella copri]MST77420.1 restriction endonuclease subunit S [Segatella copri]
MEWKEVRLGEVADVQTGPFGSQLHKENYVNKGTPIVTVEHLGNKWFTSQNLPMVSDEDKLRLAKYCSQEGDVIFSRVGSVDRCSYVSKEYSGWLFSGRCLRVRPRSGINPEYLYYFLTNEGTKQYIRNIAVGATMPSINTKLLNEVPITIPSLDDQRRIASILSSLDRKIELNNKINADLEEMAQAIFKNWFVDFEPFKDGKFVDSELGMIPEGWKVGRADDFYQINIGKTPPRKEHKWFSTNPADKIWVSIANMGNSGIFISDSSEYLTKEAVDRHNIIMVPRNTILLSFKLTVGRVAIADKELTTNEAIARFILSDDKYMEYLYLYLKNFDYNSLGSTSSIATAVNSKTIKGIQMLQPSDKIIDAFHIQVNPIFEKIRSLTKENSRLSSLRDTLLPRLMSGELEVPE